MFSFIAAATERVFPVHRRRLALLVCTGAASALVIAAFLVPPLGTYLGPNRTILSVLAALLLGCSATAWLRQSMMASRARLRAALDQAEVLDRANAELRRFARSVAHELRAPLVSTSGYLDMARENALSGDGGDLMQLLDRASATARRMDGLICGLLDLATGDGAEVSTPVSLDTAVHNSLDDLAPALDRFGVEVRRTALLGLALGDPRYIQQAFDNILGNALKHGRPEDPRATPIIEIRAERHSNGIWVSVADNGPGIALSRRESLLRGDRTDVRPQGAAIYKDGERPLTGGNVGMGLGLVRQALKECGGSLAIQTSALGGAEFILQFRADPCVLSSLIPATLPKTLPRLVLDDHASCSSKTTLTTG